MSDANDDNNGRPAGGRAPLTLKPRSGGGVSTGTVKQSFSHGRTKTVVVETKRRRPDAPAPEPRGPSGPTRPPRPDAAAAAPAQPTPTPRPTPAAAAAETGLSREETERRQRVIDAARAEQERQQAIQRAEDERRRAEEDARRREAEAARAAEEAARRAAEPPAAETPKTATAAPAAPKPPEPVRASVAPARPAATPAVYGDRPRPATAAPSAAASRPAAPAPSSRPSPSAGAGGYSDRPRPAPSASAGYGERSRQADRPATYGDRPQGARPGGASGSSYGARPGAGGAGAPSYGDRPRGPRGPEGSSPGYGARPGAGGGAGGYGARPSSGPAYGDRPREGGAAGYGDRPRGPRPEGGGASGGGYGARPAGAGGGYGARPPREGGAGGGGGDGTVRYSALSARPAGPRGPGGPGARAGAPSAPELTKLSRPGPRSGDMRRPLGGDDEDGRRKAGVPARPSALARTRGQQGRREGRLTIQTVAGDEDSAERMRSLASVRRAREREKEKRRGGAAEQARTAREVVIPDVITVGELANRMAIRAVDVIKFMMRQGIMLKINDVIDTDTAELVATEYGMTVRRVSESDVETGFIADEDAAEDTLPRPPVVAVMGHVDHGKTSLLDALRKASVVSGEAGGITQHIGAYQVTTATGEHVTFLDTPGHAAFSAMRARGANVTDLIILVVAADDGVMPQTVEAINHAKASGAPMIVAINKIDKPDANPQRVINELLQHEIVVESLGGDTQVVEVSATQKLGLDDLLSSILIQAEVMDLRANPNRTGEGTVIESKLDKGRGPVATVLVSRGTLKRGDIVVAGSQWGRVRALVDENGKQKPTAGPSEPVEVLGLDGAPDPGEAMAVVENEARAREIVEYRQRLKREKQVGPTGGVSMADVMARLQNKKVSELTLVIKADVAGSAEAITTSIQKLGNDEVSGRIIHSAVGGITESDVLLAKGANAPIIGFNVRASAQARALAEREGVEIRYYAIIYDLLDDIRGVLSGMLAPIQRETFLGNAEILQVFDISKVGKIGGCRVTEGTVRKGARVRILRNDVVIHDLGTLVTLKRFKDEVNEVVAGQECGMNFGTFQDVKEGDFIECFTLEEIKRSL